jgi:anti-sigma factor ChrR (cupin superfamily)
MDANSVSGDDEALNGDLRRRVVVDTEKMEWHPSPSGEVLRKRLHRVGSTESGQVTSLFRYPPGASFPEHPHPEGEEIFVIEGVFSDQSGDAEAGCHLLNPEGFRHAPYSEPGCLIFVKLRQYGGAGRPHRRTETGRIPWQATEFEGVSRKTLFDEPSFSDVTTLERWEPGASPGVRHFDSGVEIFVLEGACSEGDREYGTGTWLRRPAGSNLNAFSHGGGVFYLKTGAFPTLRSIEVDAIVGEND